MHGTEALDGGIRRVGVRVGLCVVQHGSGVMQERAVSRKATYHVRGTRNPNRLTELCAGTVIDR